MRGLPPEKLAPHMYEMSSFEIAIGPNTTWKKRRTNLLQLSVLSLSRHQNWNIRIRILPKPKELRISRPGLSRIPRHRITPRNPQMRQRPQRKIQSDSAMIQKFLKLTDRRCSIVRQKLRLATNVNRIHRAQL